MFLLVRSNLKKTRKTSFAFFLLLMATMLLSYTGSQLTGIQQGKQLFTNLLARLCYIQNS